MTVPPKSMELVDRFERRLDLSKRADTSSIVEATIQVHEKHVIPKESKTLLKSGKLSVKQMPKTTYYDSYQDYVCVSLVRVARELFALLPMEVVIANATTPLLNTKTGHMAVQPVLSVVIPRATLEGAHLGTPDPSDAMSYFVHRMQSRKTKRFLSTHRLKPSDLQVPGSGRYHEGAESGVSRYASGPRGVRCGRWSGGGAEQLHYRPPVPRVWQGASAIKPLFA